MKVAGASETSPHLAPINVIVARGSQVKWRKVDCREHAPRQVVAQESGEAAGATSHLQHARLAAVCVSYSARQERPERCALHGVLFAGKERLSRGLVHIGGLLGEPAICLVMK